MKHDGRVVSGIHVTQPPPGAVELRVEESDEAVAGDYCGTPENSGARTEFPATRTGRGKPADTRLKIRHQHRRCHSFSRDVRDAKPECVLIKREKIIIISANDARGLPGSGDLVSSELRNLFRQKTLLNRASFHDFALLLV